MRSAGVRMGASVAVAAAFAVATFATPAEAAAQYAHRQVLFGPLMLAMERSYDLWLAGSLRHRPPDASSFRATLDGSGDPYKISFVAVPGHALATAANSVRASELLTYDDPDWPAAPISSIPLARGPLTLSGAYVRAYLAAARLHQSRAVELGDDFAYENSVGSGVVIAVLPSHRNDILVGFVQMARSRDERKHMIGCFKEQYYLVDPSTFVATKTRIGCVG